MKIGKFGVWTVDMARDRAREILVDIARGRDPIAEKHARRHSPTVADTLARFMAEQEPYWKPPSRKANKQSLRHDILPHLGDKKGRRDIRDRGRAMVPKTHSRTRHG
jgi:hypothetical protein